jgi:hypothetical protein
VPANGAGAGQHRGLHHTEEHQLVQAVCDGEVVATDEGAAMVDDVLAGLLRVAGLLETAVPASRRPLLGSCPPPDGWLSSRSAIALNWTVCCLIVLSSSLEGSLAGRTGCHLRMR